MIKLRKKDIPTLLENNRTLETFSLLTRKKYNFIKKAKTFEL